MTPAQRREKIARELWPDYDARVARGRKVWATVGVVCAISGLMVGYTPGGFLVGIVLIGCAGLCARAAL